MLASLPTLYFHIFAVFSLYLHQVILVNVKIEIKGYMNITLKAELKLS